MQCRVYVTVGCPSVRLLVPSYDRISGVFAAEHHVGRTYRSTTAGAGRQQQQHCSTAFSSQCRQAPGSVVLTAELTRLNTDLFLSVKVNSDIQLIVLISALSNLSHAPLSLGRSCIMSANSSYMIMYFAFQFS